MLSKYLFTEFFLMIEEIRNFGKQFDVALDIAKKTDLPEWKDIQSIYLCGMGGSSLPGDIVNTLLDGEVEIKFVRDYDIPVKENYENDLYILASFSGNTEEVLSCLSQVEKVDASFVIMAHGGKLKHIVEEKEYSFLEVPSCKQPRVASGYFFTFLLVILSQLGKVSLTWFDELLQLGDFITTDIVALEKKGKELAKQLHRYLPIIYSDRSLKAIARIAKINFNENTKIQAFRNEIPEMNHNELVGFTTLITKPMILLLKSQYMHPRNRKRMDVMEKVLGDEIPFVLLEAKGENHLQEVFWMYVLMGFTSYYLALEYGVDPMPVNMVEEFKLKLISKE